VTVIKNKPAAKDEGSGVCSVSTCPVSVTVSLLRPVAVADLNMDFCFMFFCPMKQENTSKKQETMKHKTCFQELGAGLDGKHGRLGRPGGGRVLQQRGEDVDLNAVVLAEETGGHVQAPAGVCAGGRLGVTAAVVTLRRDDGHARCRPCP
jgi:hypothetical protein